MRDQAFTPSSKSFRKLGCLYRNTSCSVAANRLEMNAWNDHICLDSVVKVFLKQEVFFYSLRMWIHQSGNSWQSTAMTPWVQCPLQMQIWDTCNGVASFKKKRSLLIFETFENGKQFIENVILRFPWCLQDVLEITWEWLKLKSIKVWRCWKTAYIFFK